MLSRAVFVFVVLVLACVGAGRGMAEPEREVLSENASAAELLKIARDAREKKDGETERQVFVAACRKAAGEDRKPLTEHLRGYNPEWIVSEQMYAALVVAAIRNDLPKTIRTVEFPDVTLPESLAKYPESLREAAAYSLRVRRPYEALSKSVTERRDVRANVPRFNGLVLRAIVSSDVTAEQVLAFYEVLCLCGRERSVTAGTQAAAALLLLMREQRWPEAAGAALSFREFGYASDEGQGVNSVLSLAGIDEGKLRVGEIAIEASSAPASKRRLVSLLKDYLKTPGDDRVGVLIDLAKASPPEQLHIYIQGLTYFLTKNPEPQRKQGLRMFWGAWGSWSDENVYVEHVPAVSAEASRRALEYLCDVASPSLSNKEALALVRAFERRYLKESYPALRTLLSHPAGRVVDGAKRALIDAEQEAQARNVPCQFQYRLLVNGQPLKNTRINVVVDRSWSAGGVPTSEDGTINVEQGPFVDPQPGVRETIVESRRELEPGVPIFARRLSLPNDIAKVTDVEIVAQKIKVRLKIPRHDVEFAEKKMEITLTGPRLDVEVEPAGLTYVFDVPAKREFAFPPLSTGEYELRILFPGCASWAGKFQVEADREIEIDFQKGCDVQYSIASSDPGVRFVVPQLFKDGKEMKLERSPNGLIAGLPLGRYVLRIPSSGELRRKTGLHLDEATRFGATEIPFVLNESSPALVDLCAIALPAPSGGE